MQESEGEIERMKMTKGQREYGVKDSELDTSVSAVSAGIIRLGETIGLCSTTVR